MPWTCREKVHYLLNRARVRQGGNGGFSPALGVGAGPVAACVKGLLESHQGISRAGAETQGSEISSSAVSSIDQIRDHPLYLPRIRRPPHPGGVFISRAARGARRAGAKSQGSGVRQVNSARAT